MNFKNFLTTNSCIESLCPAIFKIKRRERNVQNLEETPGGEEWATSRFLPIQESIRIQFGIIPNCNSEVVGEVTPSFDGLNISILETDLDLEIILLLEIELST